MTPNRAALKTNVRAPDEPLFGRDAMCDALVGELAAGAPVVSLIGTGGIGKSRVAREVAVRRVDADPRLSVVLCPLADARDERGLVHAIARAAGLAAPSSRGKDPLAALAARLGGAHPLLLVLDDADAVISEAARLVAACRARTASVTFLVTSREALGIDGERVHRLGALDLEASRKLFESRADGGSWTDQELDALLHELDGLPLAIELAARRSRLLPPGSLASKISAALGVLKSSRRDVAARHATLEATIEWSLGRLDADQSRGFAVLGLFEGPLTIDAFEAVAGPLLEADPLDVAEALLKKSLVTSLDTEGAARLTMLRMLRAAARTKLRELDPAAIDAATLRHAELYVARAEAAATRAYGSDAEAALDDLEDALPNLVRAFETQKDARPALAARAVVALADLVVFRNVIDLESPLFREATRAADAARDAGLRVRTRVIEGKVALELGAPEGAATRLEEALAIADEASLADDAALVRRTLSWARIALGQGQSARELLERALETHRARGDARGEADALAARALTRCFGGEIAEGHADLERAHALHVSTRDAIRREKVLEMAALVGVDIEDEAAGGSLDEAIARLEASAAAHRSTGRLWREALARFRIARLRGDASAEISEPSSIGDGEASSQEGGREASSRGEGGNTRGARGAEARWLVGVDARWLGMPDGTIVDLTRHGSLRQVLDALVGRRLAEPGVATTANALLEAGWPGERVRHQSGMLRVYSAIKRLRALGLGAVLVTRDDGYLLEPSVGFERRDARPK